MGEKEKTYVHNLMSDSTVILRHVIQVSEGDLGDREEGGREREITWRIL